MQIKRQSNIHILVGCIIFITSIITLAYITSLIGFEYPISIKVGVWGGGILTAAWGAYPGFIKLPLKDKFAFLVFVGVAGLIAYFLNTRLLFVQ